MSYKAIVSRIKNVRPHPNADCLQIAIVNGYNIIVGLDTKEGELGIFFPTDGQIVHEHLIANNLYRKHPETNELMGGYFEHNRRVKATKLRGSISEGFWQPLDSLQWTGCDFSKLKEGQELDNLGNHKLCNKYYTPATLKLLNNNKTKKNTKEKLKLQETIVEHYNTPQLRSSFNSIQNKSVIYITEKLHGTSGRTGYLKLKESKLKTFFNKLFNINQYKYISGTRRTVLMPNNTGYYDTNEFRLKIHNQIKQLGLKKGETLYYEIVGYLENQKPIMANHTLQDKSLIKKYGKTITYSYKCEPGQSDWYVYRITQKTLDGNIIELSMSQLINRCIELGIKHVPILDTVIYNKEDMDEFVKTVETHANVGPSILDKNHIKEGVVCRVENHQEIKGYKYKGFLFCECEGIAKNNPKYIDIEEVG